MGQLELETTMWTKILEYSALILGIAISLYTVYTAIDGILIRRR